MKSPAEADEGALRPAQARALHLAAQGLLSASRRRARPGDVVEAVTRMRLLQIDSIHVVARSPYLVLHARLGDFPPGWLDQSLEQGFLAECWAHEACFVPASDLPLHRAWRERGAHWAHRHAERMRREHPDDMGRLLAHVREAGPVRTADFAGERPAGSAGWWSWKPEKRWLEAWFALGELMVARRERFQRVYDIAERVLAGLQPPFVPSRLDPAALRRQFILDSVRALGIARARWIADYYRLRPAVSESELAPLVAAGDLLQIRVDGWPAPAYVHPDHRELLARARRNGLRATRTALLSPFDPVVWDRRRASELFDFDYTLECYTPAARRRYGYFVLPILHRGRLIGRLDAKAHRARGEFHVTRLFLDPGVRAGEGCVRDVAGAIADLARWHGTPQVVLQRSEPAAFGAALRRAWAGAG